MLFLQPYLLGIQFTNDNQHPTFSLSLFTVRKKTVTYQVMYSGRNTQISPIEHEYIPAKINKIDRLAQITPCVKWKAWQEHNTYHVKWRESSRSIFLNSISLGSIALFIMSFIKLLISCMSFTTVIWRISNNFWFLVIIYHYITTSLYTLYN